VTGGAGLVGSWLVRRLVEAGADVVCLVRDWVPQSEMVRSGLLDKVPVVRGDVCDQDLMERTLGEYEISTVIHLAAQTIVGIANRNPVSTFESNIKGTWSLHEACRRSPKVSSIVVASSDKAYGESPVLPYTEDMPLAGTFPYEVSKSMTDLVCRSYAITYGVPVAVARCGNIYGPGDLNWSRIVPGTFRSILRDEQPILRSDGTFLRDYLHVDDVVSAYLALVDPAENNPGHAYNFSDESPASVLEIYAACCVAAGVPGLEPKILNKAVGEIKDQYLDSSLARSELKWQAEVSLADGLASTFAWYKDLLGSAR